MMRESSGVIDMPDDTAFNGLFSSPDYHNLMTYEEYRKVTDSFNVMKNAREMDNKGNHYSGTGIGVVGIRKVIRPDPNDMRIFPEIEFSYYFSLNGYKLDPDARFFMQDNTYNLALVKWTSVKTVNEVEHRKGHYERKAIPVRYSPGDNYNEPGALLFQLTKTQHKWISGLIFTVTILFILITVICYFGFPAQLLINISRGNPFHERNIYYLKMIFIFLAAQVAFGLLTPYIFHLLFNKRIPAEFTMRPFIVIFVDNLYNIIAAVAVFLIAKAFQRGHKLQQEQDLTI